MDAIKCHLYNIISNVKLKIKEQIIEKKQYIKKIIRCRYWSNGFDKVMEIKRSIIVLEF
jgi:hypothetical protein